MVVDCHVNIWNDEHVSPDFTTITARAREHPIPTEADADAVHAAMAPVDKAIVFTLRYGDSIGVEGEDAVTAAAVKKYPQKFIGFAYLDPRRRDYMDRLRHAIETLGLRGVKFGPIYNGIPLDDPRLEPVYQYLARSNVPLTMHMGTNPSALHSVELGRPIHAEAVARRHPDLKLILAHMGHPWYEECIVVIRKQPNVYAEVSALHYRPWQFYNILICAQEYTVHNRNKIFWGTDFPFTTVEASIADLKNANRFVEGTSLPRVTQETIDSILYSNPFEHWWHGGLKV